MLVHFQNSFTVVFSIKFAVKSILQFLPHVASLWKGEGRTASGDTLQNGG